MGARWGAARGLAAIGSNGATGIREWLGGGLKSLGEVLEREQETEEGEREQVVKEVFVSFIHRVSFLECQRY